MNIDIMRQAGLSEHVSLFQAGQCPFCRKILNLMTEFRDELSRKEYRLSGLCQDCQDETFNADWSYDGFEGFF